VKIAFDAQLVFEKQKTGIGWTSEFIMKNIIKENSYVKNNYSEIKLIKIIENKEKINEEVKNNKKRSLLHVVYKTR